MEAIRDEEEEKYDNLPEGLQESEMGETLQEVYDKLDSIAGSLDMIVDDLGSVAEELDEVVTL